MQIKLGEFCLYFILLVVAGCASEPARGSAAKVEEAGAAAGSVGQAVRARFLALQAAHPAWIVVEESPFVVVADGDPESARAFVERTIRWSLAFLRREYFPRELSSPVEIWLLDGDESYQQHAQRLTGSLPDTPYGFYEASQNRMIMNIATGGGTLIHELVHPYVRENFPGCPAWLNEGLASLYEGCAYEEDRLVGLPNWRLSGLLAALEDNTAPRFEALCRMSEAEFYGGGSDANYAVARYLLLYLQERGRLQGLWRGALASGESDKGGCSALALALGGDLGDAFEVWARWVRSLAR